MKKTLMLTVALMAAPMVASAAQGIIGDCSDCHTMHNSKSGQAVATTYNPATGTFTVGDSHPQQNLLSMDCIACHANPNATGGTYTLTGGSVVPQVMHSGSGTDDLAGGNFRYSNKKTGGSDRKGHNVIDIDQADGSNGGTTPFAAPPGKFAPTTHDDNVFSVATDFDAFTCAGARGCHGTRSQILSGSTGDWDNNASTANTFAGVRRTGIAAISGAHHNSFDGAKTDDGYQASGHAEAHDGATVAAGYRFIPGLKGYGNEAARWKNVDSASHNEYYAHNEVSTSGQEFNTGCGTCHQEDTATGGLGSRAAFNSYLKVPGNDMSGFCSTCHGVFHSSGTQNGTSGAFLRHPSDWVIPEAGEYAAYDVYDITAPVGRQTITAGMSASSTVTGGQDMVMCLSCHQAHATENDYMLRFPYSYDGTGTMQAGAYADITSATAEGGCLACHTAKGVLPENR